ncbi:MAG: cupin domain-containing protein [Acetobacteraceae bacterium]
MSAITDTAPAAAPEVAVASAAHPMLVPGRRDYFTYRDLGVTRGSQGRIRAQVTAGRDGMTQSTGWHIHLCEGQFVYMINGWIDLEFADRTVRLEAGDSVFIPGGTPHNETGASTSFELLEISVPAEMGTKPCDPPDGHA